MGPPAGSALPKRRRRVSLNATRQGRCRATPARANQFAFMENSNLLRELVMNWATQMPLILVCVAAIILTLSRWKQAPGANLWALLGFGLALVLCLLVPLSQVVVRTFLLKSGQMSSLGPTLGALAVLWSLLRAASYGLLLVALLAGRPKEAAAPAQAEPWETPPAPPLPSDN